MSIMSDVGNFLSGGKQNQSDQAIQQAMNYINGINAPTAQSLQLSPLAQFYNSGNLNAAQMQAAQQGASAYNSENLSSAPMSAMQTALSQNQQIAAMQGMTPQQRAAIAQTEQNVDQNIAGQRGALDQSFAARGVPQALISAALQNQDVGQQAQQAYQNSLQAQGQAANEQLGAIANSGALGNAMFQNQAGQANTVAAAQNALNQFNTANTQQANVQNLANQQASNVYNTTNAQNLANKNVTGQQQVQYQNQVNAPQQAFTDAATKGQLLGDTAGKQATLLNQQGLNNTGLASGFLGTVSNKLGMPVAASGGGAPTAAWKGGQINTQPVMPPMNFKGGGPVPGHAMMSGNSPRNDTVPAMLSPGEVVVPRNVIANPRLLPSFLNNRAPQFASNIRKEVTPMAHPSDLAAIMKALSVLRGLPA